MTNKRVIISLAAVAGIAAWFYFVPKVSQTGEYKQAQISPQVENVPKETVQSKVQVYAAAAKKKLGLTKAKQNDSSIAVLDSSKLPPSDHPQTVTTTLDTDTGTIETEVKQEPLPLIAAEQTGYIRIGYGIKTGRGKIARISISENLIQIKSLHAGLDASIDTDGTGYAGAHIDYGW